MKPITSFGPHKLCKDGINSRCKVCACEKSKLDYRNRSVRDRLFDRARTRAKKKGREFSLKRTDIKIPEVCPVFKVPMVGKYAPSLDRIDSEKGYIPGNVQVISTRANTLKNNASVEEIEELLNWLKKN